MAGALLISTTMAAQPPRLIDVEFLHRSAMIPPHRRVRAAVYAIALAIHAVLIVVLVVAQRSRPVRIGPGDATHAGIAAYIPGPMGTAGAAPQTAAAVERPKKPVPTRAAEKTSPSHDDAADSSGAVGTTGTQSGTGGGSGPVRLGSGAGATLLKKVTPIYPRMLETARIPGAVVLDAIIHRDGTIGDITVLNSSNPAFTQSAIAAVKQWLYAPLPYEGIVTVTVNFAPAR